MEHLDMMITIDCTGIETRQQLHQALAQALDFPEWYGQNLDALHDCLTDLDETILVLTNWAYLPDWAEGFAKVFAYAQEENPCLHVSME